MPSKGKFTPRLVIVAGKDKGKIIPLESGTTIIGRSQGDVLLEDSRLSRSHLAIHCDFEKQAVAFSDLQSLNGTFVNDQRLASGNLEDGDQIFIGNSQLDCQLYAQELTASINLPKQKKQFVPVPQNDTSTDLALESKVGSSEGFEQREIPKSIWNRFHPRTRRIFLGLTAIFVLLWVFLKDRGVARINVDEQLKQIRELEAQNDWRGAYNLAVDLEKKIPDNFDLLMNLGEINLQLKKIEPAILAYQKAHTVNPNDPMIHLKLIRAYLKVGLNERAKEEVGHVDVMVREERTNRDFYLEAAKIFLEFRELEGATRKAIVLAKALQTELAPDSTVGFKLEAQILFQENQPALAYEVLSQAHQLDSQDEWVVENMALAKFRLKDYDGAKENVIKWLEINPTNTKALLIMAYLKIGQQDIEGALANLQKIRETASTEEKDPIVAEALYLSGLIYHQKNELEQSKDFFETSCKLGYQKSCDALSRPETRVPQSVDASKESVMENALNQLE